MSSTRDLNEQLQTNDDSAGGKEEDSSPREQMNEEAALDEIADDVHRNIGSGGIRSSHSSSKKNMRAIDENLLSNNTSVPDDEAKKELTIDHKVINDADHGVTESDHDAGVGVASLRTAKGSHHLPLPATKSVDGDKDGINKIHALDQTGSSSSVTAPSSSHAARAARRFYEARLRVKGAEDQVGKTGMARPSYGNNSREESPEIFTTDPTLSNSVNATAKRYEGRRGIQKWRQARKKKIKVNRQEGVNRREGDEEVGSENLDANFPNPNIGSVSGGEHAVDTRHADSDDLTSLQTNQDDEVTEPPPDESPAATPDEIAMPGAYDIINTSQIPSQGNYTAQVIRRRSLSGIPPASSANISDSASGLPAAEAVAVGDLENNIREQILANAARGEVVEPKKETFIFDATCCEVIRAHKMKLLCMTLFSLVLAAVISLSVSLTGGGSSNVHESDATVSVLDTIINRGLLRCDNATFLWETQNVIDPFYWELCHAIAAAIFGDRTRVQFVNISVANKFVTLGEGGVDLLTGGYTHTFERDLFEATAKTGFSFSTPYLYDGLSFGGIPPYSSCAGSLSTTGNCVGLSVCVLAGTTWMDTVEDVLPASHIVAHTEIDEMYKMLVNGTCNVISGERTYISEATVKLNGYHGPYELANRTFSKEPLSVVTRDHDSHWSLFVDWAIQALFVAEELGISQANASSFFESQTTTFGTEFMDVFRNVIAAVGNYGEMYERHLEGKLPRNAINEINKGSSGLLYSHPFGALGNIGPDPISGGTLERIAIRGELRCGITVSQDVMESNTNDTYLRELDSDFCHAVAASAVQSTNDAVLVDIHDEEEGYVALANGTIDVFSGASNDIQKFVRNPLLDVGFSFSRPYFYGFGAGIETRSLATKQDDPQWSSFVYWVVMSTFYAEEEGISQEESLDMPLVGVLGQDYNRMYRDAIRAVGNYGEIYDRNVNARVQRQGRNELNIAPLGPQHYPLPLY